MDADRVVTLPSSDSVSRRTTLRWLSGGGLAATLGLLGPGTGKAAASIEQNEEIARRLVEAVNARQLDSIDDVIAEDILIHVALPLIPPETRGWEAGKQNLAAIVTALPDAILTLDEVIATEDRFALRVTFAGSHTGDVLGVVPTGKSVSISGIYLAHVESGKIVEAWLLYDAPPWVQLIGQAEQTEADDAIAVNEAIGPRVFEALNTRDLELLDEVIAADVVVHAALVQPLAITERGLDAAKRSLAGVVTALPDAVFTLDESFATGDRLAIRATLTGTHTGEYLGVPPSGKELTVTGLHFAHVADGKIVEIWHDYSAPAWVDLIGEESPAATSPAAASPVVDVAAASATLDDLLLVPGVVAAIEFAPDGTLAAYRSEIDIPRTEVEETAAFVATANSFLPALLARYNELSSLEWSGPRWLVFSTDDWTAVIAGTRALVAETATADFNQMYGALVGAR